MRRGFIIATLALAALVAVLPARAANISLSYDFVAFGFSPIGGLDPAPVNPVTGRFSLTFDNSADISESAAGLSVSNLNLPPTPNPVFSYLQAQDMLVLRGIATGILGVIEGTDDYTLVLENVSTNPVAASMFYTSVDNDLVIWGARGVLLSAVIPEPASLALLGFALAGLAAARRAHKAAPQP